MALPASGQGASRQDSASVDVREGTFDQAPSTGDADEMFRSGNVFRAESVLIRVMAVGFGLCAICVVALALGVV